MLFYVILSILGLILMFWICFLYVLNDSFEDIEIDIDVEELNKDMFNGLHLLRRFDE